MDSLSLAILQVLQGKEACSSNEIAALLSVSERTVRSRIKEMEEELFSHGAQIVTLRGIGYHLNILNKDAFAAWMDTLYAEKKVLPNSSEDRVSYLIDDLLYEKDYVYMDDLCDRLSVARNTLSTDLKKAEQIFYRYHLKIERRPNYGMRIVGKEADKRTCIVEQITRNNRYLIDQLKGERAIAKLSDVLAHLFHKAGYSCSVPNYEITKYTGYISSRRAQNGFEISFSKEERESLLQELPSPILSLAEEITAGLAEDFPSLSKEDEKLYLAMQLRGRGYIGEEKAEEIPGYIDTLLERMLAEVRSSLNLDFSEDRELISAMRHHLTALDLRMRYLVPVENRIMPRIKKNYPLAYVIARYAAFPLSDYYQRSLSEDEVSYFAINFQMALERLPKRERKKNVVIVTISGNTTSRFFAQKFREAFGDLLENLYECSDRDLPSFDFAGKQIDCCFTSMVRKIKLPVPNYWINIFPSEEEIRHYRTVLQSMDEKELSRYFEETLFVSDVSADSKEEALRQFTSQIQKNLDVPADFQKRVLEGEKYGMTAFSNKIAVLHPGDLPVKKSMVAVMVLKEPLNWGNSDVQIVLYPLMKKGEDSRRLLETLARLLSREDIIRQLSEAPSLSLFIQLLSHISEH